MSASAAAGRLLHERERILDAWEASVRDAVPEARALEATQIRNNLPRFLERLGEALDEGTHPEVIDICRAHGHERAWRGRFTLAGVLTEYGLLRKAIFSAIESDGVIEQATRNRIIEWIDVGMTEAAGQFAKTYYAREQSLREDVAQGRQALAQSLEARDQFISFAMHELRSPIASILLGLQLMKKTAEKGAVDGDRILRLLEAPLRQLERLTGMVDTLLDVARIENARLVLDTGRHDLCAIAHDVSERLAGLARVAGSSLKVAACQPVYGHWDRVRLEQVITNLVTNAVKYGKGHPIDISVRKTSDGLAELAVTDRGIGIAPEDRERIFRRYERIADEHHRESLGLGLYIVREIVTAHRGRIEVRSEPGRGSTFSVFLTSGEAP